MTAVVVAGTAMTALGLTATLTAERTGRQELRLVAKPSASAGFLLVAVGSGALDDGYGLWILAGLVLSLAGDVFLMFDRWFRAGLVAFLVAHLAYLAAFVVAGVAAPWAVTAGALAAATAAVVVRWLVPHVERTMRGPVLAYVVVISVMVALAWGAAGAGNTVLIVVGATLFYLSDLFVARERFVTPAFTNRLLGLPLYYAGQVLLALSVGR